ncbi:MAG: methyltransferase domain-containing protein [Leptolyngbya sp. SIO4C1]|nr:methyltransferase domain-containing protein [Leptolyngbya sp. SIO4C1]
MNAVATRLVNGVLSVKPLAEFAKHQARSMMIKRAESIGVYWRDEVKQLRSRGSSLDFDPAWETELAAIAAPQLAYPDYYLASFHAYAEGNLGWLPAMEVESAARAVHAKLWPEGDARGDLRLRQSYHQVLQAQLSAAPQAIVDLGCSVGLDTFLLQATYPDAQITGVDLSPYFLAVAQYRQSHSTVKTQDSNFIRWVHAPAESTGLPAESADLVSACLMFHELPQSAAIAVLHEAARLVKPGGHLALMDMNPQSEVYAQMPPYVLTLLKSTEPYLDEYFALEIETAIVNAGFEMPTVTYNTVRHRTLIAKKQSD